MIVGGTRFITHLGETYLLADRGEDAIAAATRALALARERGERGREAWALRLLGEIASHQDLPNVGEAEGHYRQAMELAQALGMRPLVARCHLGLGKLARRMDQPQRAQEELTTATKMLREMGTRYWQNQTEAELRMRGEVCRIEGSSRRLQPDPHLTDGG